MIHDVVFGVSFVLRGMLMYAEGWTADPGGLVWYQGPIALFVTRLKQLRGARLTMSRCFTLCSECLGGVGVRPSSGEKKNHPDSQVSQSVYGLVINNFCFNETGGISPYS
jgi:hypothetical protein